MRQLRPALALLLAAPLAALPQPAAAIEESEREDPYYYYSALSAMQDEAFALDTDTQREEKTRMFLRIADEAESAQQLFADRPEEVIRFAQMQGISLYYAADYHEFDDANTEARMREIAWLLDGIDAFERTLPEDTRIYFPFYEYTGAADLLFRHGAWLGDPRLPQWALAKVQAHRRALRSFAATASDPATLVFPKNALAQSLLEFGFLVQNEAYIGEGNAILEALGEDDVDYSSYAMREAVAEGRAPFPAPGEVD